MTRKFKHAFWGAALLALGAIVPATSSAFLLDAGTVNTVYTINFLLEEGETANTLNTVQDLSATVLFKHTAWDAGTNTLSVEIDVTNTSTLLGNEAGLWKLAFGMDPNATSVTLTHLSGANKFKNAQVTIDPALVNNVLDLSVGSQASTDPGYPSTLQEQQQDKFRLDFVFTSLGGDGVEFSPFGSFWQTSTESFQFGDNGNGGGPGGNGNGIPEPASLALLGVGLLAMGWVTRRRYGSGRLG
jgi:hypothetical protein